MRWIITSAGLLALMLWTAGTASALSPKDVVGTWKLVSNVRQAEGSQTVVNNMGAHPHGMMIITPDHRFMMINTGEGRKPANTTEGLAALQKSEVAYSGLLTFSADPGNPRGLEMIDHVDIAWNEAWAGTSQTRFLSLDGNRLTIHTPVIKNPVTGENAVSTLVFERSK